MNVSYHANAKTHPSARSLKKSLLAGSSNRRNGPSSTVKPPLYIVIVRAGVALPPSAGGSLQEGKRNHVQHSTAPHAQHRRSSDRQRIEQPRTVSITPRSAVASQPTAVPSFSQYWQQEARKQTPPHLNRVASHTQHRTAHTSHTAPHSSITPSALDTVGASRRAGCPPTRCFSIFNREGSGLTKNRPVSPGYTAVIRTKYGWGKTGTCIGFCVYRASYLVWTAVAVISWVLCCRVLDCSSYSRVQQIANLCVFASDWRVSGSTLHLIIFASSLFFSGLALNAFTTGNPFLSQIHLNLA